MFYCFLADGFEEIEAIATVDILRRAGIECITVGIGKTEITGSHGIKVIADLPDFDIALSPELEGIFLPGGLPGAINLGNSTVVQSLIDYCVDNDIIIGAICAAPAILGNKGLLKTKRFTCFPGIEKGFEWENYTANSVEVDGKIATGNGPGATFDLAYEIAGMFIGKRKVDFIRAGMQFKKL